MSEGSVYEDGTTQRTRCRTGGKTGRAREGWYRPPGKDAKMVPCQDSMAGVDAHL